MSLSTPIKSKARGLYSISRFISSSMIGLAMIVGVFTAGGLNADIPFSFYFFIFLGGTLVAVHAMVFNDILDIEIDRINAPHRALPSGLITLKEAKFYQILIGLFGILSFYFADISRDESNFTWWYGLIHIVLSDLYSWKLKKTGFLGNLIVSYMTYAAFLHGDIVINSGLTPITQGLGIAAFFVSLSREIVKGLMDIEGDEKFNVKTVAVLFGEKNTSNLAMLTQIIIIVICIYPIFILSGILGRLGSILVIIYMFYLIFSNSFNYDHSNAKKVKTQLLFPPLIITPFVIFDTIA